MDEFSIPEEEEQEEEEQFSEGQTTLRTLPPNISDTEKGELFRELTTILSRKWVKDKDTVFGCSELDLLLATRFDVQTLRDTLEEYRLFTQVIGLDVVEYELEGERWYCLKTSMYAPSDLNESELIILGTIIGMIEDEEKIPVTSERVREKLVVTGKMKEYLVDIGLRNLVKQGYLRRDQNQLKYNFRTLIEFGDLEREKILEEYRKI